MVQQEFLIVSKLWSWPQIPFLFATLIWVFYRSFVPTVSHRFSKERCASRHPCAFTAFGVGPRNCLGMRFSLLEGKMALVRFLQVRERTCWKFKICDASFWIWSEQCFFYVSATRFHCSASGFIAVRKLRRPLFPSRQVSSTAHATAFGSNCQAEHNTLTSDTTPVFEEKGPDIVLVTFQTDEVRNPIQINSERLDIFDVCLVWSMWTEPKERYRRCFLPKFQQCSDFNCCFKCSKEGSANILTASGHPLVTWCAEVCAQELKKVQNCT